MADITVLSTLATEQAYRDLLPGFEQATGHKVTTSFTGTVDVKKRIAAGEAFDLLIMASDDIDAFLAAGTLKRRQPRRPRLVRGRRRGARRRGQARYRQRSMPSRPHCWPPSTVGYSTGPSGNYVLGLFERLGIADEIKPKLRLAPTGAFVGSFIANGEAEIGFQQMSELSHFAGIDLVGPLPAEIQKTTIFSSGIAAKAKEPDAAARARRLCSPRPPPQPVYRRRGLQPAHES